MKYTPLGDAGNTAHDEEYLFVIFMFHIKGWNGWKWNKHFIKLLSLRWWFIIFHLFPNSQLFYTSNIRSKINVESLVYRWYTLFLCPVVCSYTNLYNKQLFYNLPVIVFNKITYLLLWNLIINCGISFDE